MIFRQLECFLAVAKLGSMSRAANEMFLTQPTLTARLQLLEQEMDTQLFARTRSGMKLTEAGREFLPYAERCVSSFENGKQHLKGLIDGTQGHLKIGALPRVSTYSLPDFLEEFASTHPQVVISVMTGHSKDVLEMVLREEVQIGLARPMEHPEVEDIPLYEEELILVANPSHRFAGRDLVELSEVGREQLILFDRASSDFELTKSLFRETGVREPRMMELDNIEAAKRMVERGLGIAFLPRQAVPRAVAAGRLCEIELTDGPDFKRSIVAMRRRDLPLTGTASAFLQLTTQSRQKVGEA